MFSNFSYKKEDKIQVVDDNFIKNVLLWIIFKVENNIKNESKTMEQLWYKVKGGGAK